MAPGRLPTWCGGPRRAGHGPRQCGPAKWRPRWPGGSRPADDRLGERELVDAVQQRVEQHHEADHVPGREPDDLVAQPAVFEELLHREIHLPGAAGEDLAKYVHPRTVGGVSVQHGDGRQEQDLAAELVLESRAAAAVSQLDRHGVDHRAVQGLQRPALSRNSTSWLVRPESCSTFCGMRSSSSTTRTTPLRPRRASHFAARRSTSSLTRSNSVGS